MPGSFCFVPLLERNVAIGRSSAPYLEHLTKKPQPQTNSKVSSRVSPDAVHTAESIRGHLLMSCHMAMTGQLREILPRDKNPPVNINSKVEEQTRGGHKVTAVRCQPSQFDSGQTPVIKVPKKPCS